VPEIQSETTISTATWDEVICLGTPSLRKASKAPQAIISGSAQRSQAKPVLLSGFLIHRAGQDVSFAFQFIG